MTHVADLTRPDHRHPHPVWVLPDSPLGRWAAGIALGALGAAVVAGVLVALPLSGPLMFGLLGLVLWSGVVAVLAGVVAGIALVHDHAVMLGVLLALSVGAAALTVPGLG
jgi:hypothetical protein